jgi:hypothetical protein
MSYSIWVLQAGNEIQIKRRQADVRTGIAVVDAYGMQRGGREDIAALEEFRVNRRLFTSPSKLEFKKLKRNSAAKNVGSKI